MGFKSVTSLSPKWLGFFQALGVALYCGAIGTIIWNGQLIFGPVSFLGPVIFLVLFSVSALICGLIVFLRPYKLFFEDKKKEAVELVLYTTLWLFMFFLLILFSVILLR